MKNKTLLIIGMIAAGALAAWYFFIYRLSGAAAGKAVNAADDAAFQQMAALLSPKVGPSNMAWIYEATKKLLDTGTGREGQPFPADKKISGRITKTGALMAVYAAGVSGWTDNGQMDMSLNDAMYDIWYQFKTSEELTALTNY